MIGIALLGLIVSILGGCVLWLIFGDRLPFNDEIKLPPLTHIVIYSLALLVPVCVFVFFVFG